MTKCTEIDHTVPLDLAFSFLKRFPREASLHLYKETCAESYIVVFVIEKLGNRTSIHQQS